MPQDIDYNALDDGITPDQNLRMFAFVQARLLGNKDTPVLTMARLIYDFVNGKDPAP